MSAVKDNPGVIAPPPLLYAGALAIGLAVDFLLVRVRTGISASPRYGLAFLLLAITAALATSAHIRFRRAGTHVEPWKPTTALVTGGVYGLTRNPMYVAITLAYLAVAIVTDSVIVLILLIPLLFIMRYGVVAREERYLEAKFGDEYRRYRRTVRRWI